MLSPQLFMIPLVVFKYSEVYDRVLRKKGAAIISKYDFLSKQIAEYINGVEKIWKEKGKEILTELCTISSLYWDEVQIDCYLVTDTVPFSEPITIPIYKGSPAYFVDILTHELIHRLFLQKKNEKKINKIWKRLYLKYKGESQITKDHILVHALHQHIFLKLFSKKKLRREIALISYLPDYKKSWQIVLREGYKKIIDEYL